MLVIKKLSKEYVSKHREKTIALQDINLSFDETGLVFVLGPSGSGKTTLMNMIGGIDTPTTGTIILNEEEIGKSEKDLDSYRKAHVGFIFQEYNLLFGLTVYDNLALACLGLKEEEKKEKITYYLEKVGLKGYEKRYPNELSGGQSQRVAIARALLKESDFLLADEPTGNLNQSLSKELFSLFKEISKEKLIIIVSHNVDMASAYADRIIKIEDGKIIGDQIINSSLKKVPKTVIKKEETKIHQKEILKLTLDNIKTSKFDIILNSFIIILSFLTFMICLSVCTYNEIDTNIQNLKNIDEVEAFTLLENTTDFQMEYILEKHPGIKYLKDGKFSSVEELLDVGYTFYDNYQEISEGGIYVYENELKTNVKHGYIFYDKEGTRPVEYKDGMDFINLVGTYMIMDNLLDGRTVSKIQGIIDDKHCQSEQISYHFTFQFQDKEDNNNSANVRIPVCYINNQQIESCNVAKYLPRLCFVITDEELLTKYDNKDMPSNNNEVYISLYLYNTLFNEQLTGDYFFEQVGFQEYQIKHFPSHLGEKISILISHPLHPEYQIKYDNLVLKGVMFDEIGDDMVNSVVLSNECEELNYLFEEHYYLIKKDSIDDLSSFIKDCAREQIYPHYRFKDLFDKFGFELKKQMFIYFIFMISFTILSILLMYNLVNRLIKKKTNEFGILKAIGVSNKQIGSIYVNLVLILIAIYIILIIPLSIPIINMINNNFLFKYTSDEYKYYIPSEYWQDLTVNRSLILKIKIIFVYFKWWYSLILIAIIFLVMFPTMLLIIKKLKNKKAIDLIKNTTY